MAVMTNGKNFNNNNSGEFVLLSPHFTRIWHQIYPNHHLLKFLPLTYHHSHFLAVTLDFTSFHNGLLQSRTLFFYSLAVLDSFCNCIAVLNVCCYLPFSFHIGDN